MLRRVAIDQKPNGRQVTIPVEVSEKNLDQQVKRFIEIAAYSTFDGQLHITVLRDEAFRQLVERVQACRICTRMEGRTRVLGPANGDIQAQVLFVAEAPGRLGADHWGIPLFADQTGRNFETLLRAACLERSSVFITNAVLCNPRDEHGRNATPTTRELHNCSAYLCTTIEIVQPRYIVTLGRVALQALKTVAIHEAVLARDVGHPLQWNGRWLIPLYHPSPRACIHRPLQLQMEDYRRLGALVRGDK